MEDIYKLKEEIDLLSGKNQGSIFLAGMKRAEEEAKLENLIEKKKMVRDTIINILVDDNMPISKAQVKANIHPDHQKAVKEYIEQLCEANKLKAIHQQRMNRKDALEKFLSLEQSLLKLK